MKEIINQLASHDLLQGIIEGVPVRIFWKDRECRYLGCNSPFARDAGFSCPDEVTGKTDFDLSWKDQAALHRADDIAVMTSGESRLGFEVMHSGADGRVIWLRISKVPLREGERLIGVLGIYEDITASKQTESALIASEEQYRHIFDNLQEAYYKADAAGCITMVSPSAARLMGCSVEMLLGREIAQFYVDAQGREQFLRALAEAGGTISDYEARLRQSGGNIIWVSTNAHYLFDAAGDVTGVEGTIRDISRQKETERQLRLTQFVSDQASDSILWIDQQSNICYANAAACNNLKFSQEELLNMSVTDINPDLLTESWADRWQRLRQENVLSFEAVHHRKDGTTFPVEVSANMVVFGGVEYNVVFCRDISKRRQEEKKLRENEERLRLVLDATNQAWFDLDIVSGDITVSPEYARLIGYKPEEFYSSLRNWFDHIHPDDRKAVTAAFKRCLRKSGQEKVEYRRRRKGGGWEWVRSVGKIVERDAAGAPLRMIGIHTDINEQKIDQEKLRVSEERFQLAMAGANDGLWDWNLESGALYCSPRWFSMLGYGPYELPASPATWSQLVHPDDRERVLQRVKDYLEGRIATYALEMRMSHKDGHDVTVLSRATKVLRDSDGKPVRLVGTHVDITGRKQVEQKLVESEERLRLALGVARQAWFDLHIPSGKAEVSPEYPSLLGFSADEFDSSLNHWFDNLHPDDRPSVMVSFEKCMKTSEPEHIEYRRRTKKGEWIWMHAVGRLIERDGHGNPVRLIGIQTDITDRKQAEENQRNESEFRSRLLDQASEGIVLWRPGMHGRFAEFLTWNRRIQEITGYTREEINELGWLETVYMDDAERSKAREAMQRVLLGKANSSMDFEIVTKAGEIRNVHISSSLVQGPDSAPCVLAVIQDISYSKHQQRLLDASKKRFQTLFDASSDGLLIVDAHGNFIDINQTAYERLGYSKDEMLAMNLTELDAPEFVALVSDRMAKIQRYGMATFEAAHYRKNGTIMPVEINARVIELDGKSVIFSVVRDISERKEMEDKLRQSQKMEAIGTLVGGIAHDFNNMLAAVQGNLYLAQMQPDNHSEVSSKLNNINQLSLRAAEMVQQLLTFARKDTVAMRVFSLNVFMDEAYSLAKTLIPENIDHHTDVCEEKLFIKGDATQLQQVLMNLLSNAVDAVSGVDQPSIHCSMEPYTADQLFMQKHPEMKSRHYACFSVADNGSGIPHEQRDKVFEPFFTTKEVGKGTGLGLSTLYGAVQTHAGVVEMESELGKGTTFRVYLPLNTNESESVGTASPDSSCGEGQSESIMLVDDEESVRSMTAEVLMSMGYRVVEACDGRQALDIFAETGDQIDLIVSDVIMPRMGGAELIRAVRQQTENMPFIMVTGYDKNHVLDKHEELFSQQCQVINKPFDFNVLSSKIQELIKSTRIKL